MMKKVVIFGSTGLTGLCTLEAAVKKGLSVRAFVRDPAKIPGHLKDKIEIFKGNVLEPNTVQNAVKGTDGVVIVLGTGPSVEPTTDMSEGTKIILEAMKAEKVTNVSACLSAFLFDSPDMQTPSVYRDVTEDHKRMFQVLKESSLNYIAAFPPQITEEPSRKLIITINPKDSPARTISKWDLGSFLVDALYEPKYFKSIIGVANVPLENKE